MNIKKRLKYLLKGGDVISIHNGTNPDLPFMKQLQLTYLFMLLIEMHYQKVKIYN
ncbi:hypothetical protein ABC255_10720 [Neobacillus sp. 3P2-tot-E-2]|uniref:hypothetical protein n=1 Tax=Neobacillus TaxID=2675232 RepID=UPI002FFE54EB